VSRPLESCREELGEEADYERCGKPAEFILWGKLFPPEALGPRCYDCATQHVDHRALAPGSGYAIFDLRHVVEVDPMLALLERVARAMGPTGGSPGGFSVVQEVRDLLREHGRLQGDSDE
jgi:hypothetical protein